MPLFALVRGHSSRVYRISLSQSLQQEVEQIFRDQAAALLHDTDRIDFDGRYSPESDEVLCIKEFPDPDAMLTVGDNPLRCPILTVDDSSLESLIGLFVITTVDRRKTVCLQVFDRRRALTRSKFALITSVGDNLHKLEQTGLILDTSVAAVIQGTELIFKSFHTVSRLFDLTANYHEATDLELIALTEHSLIAPPPSSAAFLSLADTARIRKQVALILDSKILDTVPINTIIQQAAEFNLTVSTTRISGKKRIKLPESRPELKNFLDFLQENFYKGCLTSKTFVSNSKRSVQ